VSDDAHLEPLRVILVDDQELVRTGFRMILDAQPDMTVVGEAADGVDAVALAASTDADVILMDVRMPRLDGVEATRRITARNPSRPKVLILTTFDLDEYVYAGLRAGASGFLLKDVPPPELLAGIRAVANGEAIVAPTITRRLIDRFIEQPQDQPRPSGIDQLTERERDVLLELAKGCSNAEIAANLYLSEATVKSHIGHILTKLGLRDRLQAVIYAYDHHLVRPGGSTMPRRGTPS
jgi:DNA-binding NarL/FixJ family response regulator